LITEKVSTLKINKLSRAQYEREYLAGRLENTALYLTPDESPEFIQMTREEYDAAVSAGTIKSDIVYIVPDNTPEIIQMTKEEYEAAISAGTIKSDVVYIVPDDTPKIVQMTKEEYDAAVLAGTLDEDTVYLIPDADWTKTVNNSTRITVTVEDLTEYYFPNATYVEINLPADVTHYESWLFIGGTNATISVNGGTCLGITEYAGSYSTSCAEVSIKDGRYLIATDYIS
jgi:hypothetical protein